MKVGDDGAQVSPIGVLTIDMQADRRKHEPLNGPAGIGGRRSLEKVNCDAARADHIAGKGARRMDWISKRTLGHHISTSHGHGVAAM
jgi:hypothetical protein